MKFIGNYCIILLCISSFGLGDSKIDWCSLTCGENKTENVACKDCVLEKQCAAVKVNSGKLLEIHNQLRDKFASGQDNPTVANMNILSWDADLAYTASCSLAEKCRTDTQGECYVTPKFPKHVGQNGWSLNSETEVDCGAQAILGVQSWYTQRKLLRSISPSYNSGKDAPATDRFTQLVWAEATHIGCALIKAEQPAEIVGGKYLCHLACNYGPGGNVVGARMCKEGKPCSQCPEGMSCGKTYENLCDRNRTSHMPPNSGFIIILLLLTYYKSMIL